MSCNSCTQCYETLRKLSGPGKRDNQQSGYYVVPAYGGPSYDTLQKGSDCCGSYPTVRQAYGRGSANCDTQYMRSFCGGVVGGGGIKSQCVDNKCVPYHDGTRALGPVFKNKMLCDKSCVAGGKGGAQCVKGKGCIKYNKGNKAQGKVYDNMKKCRADPDCKYVIKK